MHRLRRAATELSGAMRLITRVRSARVRRTSLGMVKCIALSLEQNISFPALMWRGVHLRCHGEAFCKDNLNCLLLHAVSFKKRSRYYLAGRSLCMEIIIF